MINAIRNNIKARIERILNNEEWLLGGGVKVNTIAFAVSNDVSVLIERQLIGNVPSVLIYQGEIGLKPLDAGFVGSQSYMLNSLSWSIIILDNLVKGNRTIDDINTITERIITQLTYEEIDGVVMPPKTLSVSDMSLFGGFVYRIINFETLITKEV